MRKVSFLSQMENKNSGSTHSFPHQKPLSQSVKCHPEKMRELTKGAQRLTGQPAFTVLAKAQELERKGVDVLHFEIGEPDFDTPPHIRKAATDALESGKTHYVDASGISELREAVCEEIEKTRGFRPEKEQVLVLPGANPTIFYTLSCLIGRGQNLVLQDPGFMTYYAAVRFMGIAPQRVKLLEENEFRLDPDDMEKAINDKTRLLVINSPSNPTGAVLKKDEIERVADIAEEHDLYLLSDEIYSKMTYDMAHYSPAVRDQCNERTIILDGFSKAYAMTGWRLGYCVGPKEVIEKIGLLNQTVVSCTTTFAQWGGVAALRGQQKCVEDMMAEFRKRREAIISGLNSIPKITCVKPQGAFYAFPNITKTGMTSQEFADFALNEMGIALLPGTGFGPGGEGYVRLSYATSVEKINKAIERMRQKLE
jgi:aspartate aminotransferase